VVAVWKFDRFFRSASHPLRAHDTFRVLGIESVNLSESLDTATPAGRMVLPARTRIRQKIQSEPLP
jgi:DNA invertase Pin-like site-specific DNA recombinase